MLFEKGRLIQKESINIYFTELQEVISKKS